MNIYLVMIGSAFFVKMCAAAAILTTYEYLLLSSAAYDYHTNETVRKELSSRGFEVYLDLPPELTRLGYTAMAFKHKTTNSIIIAQTGTDSFMAWDFLSDFQLMLDRQPITFPLAIAFYDQVIKKMKKDRIKKEKLSFTGHSLGAALATLMSGLTKQPAVVFECPGTMKILHDMGLKIEFKDQVKCYNSRPNCVNTLNVHEGIVYRLDDPKEKIEKEPRFLPRLIHDLIKCTDLHTTTNLMRLFNATTGEPYSALLYSYTDPEAGVSKFDFFYYSQERFRMWREVRIIAIVFVIMAVLLLVVFPRLMAKWKKSLENKTVSKGKL